jgi:nitric oxide reductase NorQ protein
MTTQNVLRLQAREDFVVTPTIDNICRRALTYLEAGYPCHFRGSAGTGKTTVAMHVAHQRGRPVLLMFGDEEFASGDLVGATKGMHSTKITDNFVRSVRKTEEFRRPQWVDSRLTNACKHGYTLVYDEFSRSRPEANNVLLTVLEEHILTLPDTQCGGNHVQVHAEFRAIFTSNPEDYAGVHKTQNALLDRMITMELDFYDRETEIAITSARANVDRRAAEPVVDLVRRIRLIDCPQRPTLRASIMIARILRQLESTGTPLAENPLFLEACLDVLLPWSATYPEREWIAAREVVSNAVRTMNVERLERT